MAQLPNKLTDLDSSDIFGNILFFEEILASSWSRCTDFHEKQVSL